MMNEVGGKKKFGILHTCPSPQVCLSNSYNIPPNQPPPLWINRQIFIFSLVPSLSFISAISLIHLSVCSPRIQLCMAPTHCWCGALNITWGYDTRFCPTSTPSSTKPTLQERRLYVLWCMSKSFKAQYTGRTLSAQRSENWAKASGCIVQFSRTGTTMQNITWHTHSHNNSDSMATETHDRAHNPPPWARLGILSSPAVNKPNHWKAYSKRASLIS